MPSCRSTFVTVLSAAIAVVLAGCQDEDQIQQYTVAKPEALNARIEAPPAVRDAPPQERSPARTLGTIVPHAGQTWYFKLMGPDDAVASQEATFREFLKTVKFAGGKPTWTLPEGWREQSGSGGGLRFATIAIASEGQPLELTVIPLATPPGDSDDDLLANLNRWRDQLALPPIAQADLGRHVERLTIGDTPGTLVNIAGQASTTSSMGTPPFASSGKDVGFAHPPIPAAGQAAQDRASPDDSLPIAFEAPASWKPGKSGGLRLASFEAMDGGATAEITVIVLAPQELLPNINRWRGQVGLESTTQEQLDEDIRPVEVDGAAGHLVELFGPEQAILGAILNQGGRAWIFKLHGPTRLAQQEKGRFEAFVRSVTFK